MHPLQALDKSKPSPLVGDVWKKVYSNCHGDFDSCMKQFWEMYGANIHTRAHIHIQIHIHVHKWCSGGHLISIATISAHMRARARIQPPTRIHTLPHKTHRYDAEGWSIHTCRFKYNKVSLALHTHTHT